MIRLARFAIRIGYVVAAFWVLGRLTEVVAGGR